MSICTLIIFTFTSSLFGLYSSIIKSSLGYDQTTVSLISFFKDLGSNAGVVSGLITEVMPPWVVISIGAVLNFFGYLMIWLAVSKKILRPKVWHMCLYFCIGASSQSFANTAVKNFRESRGAVLILLKGLVVLSGAIITLIYHAVYGDDPIALILLVGWVTLVILLFIPVAIVVKEELHLLRKKKQDLENSSLQIVTEKPRVSQEAAVLAAPQRQPPPPENEEISCWAPTSIFRPPNRGEDHTILQALFSVDMLILFCVTICGFGGTLTAINNLGQIGSSLGYPKKSISTFVSLVTIWNYLGRVVAGFLSELLLKKYKFPRPLMLTLTLVISSIGHLLIAFDVPNGLYVASVIIGFCFGAQWPLLLAIISELFGLKYHSTLYNFGSLASPIGLYVLGVRVTGHLYDREAEKQLRALGRARVHGEELDCNGVKCFQLAFIIITAVTAFGAFVSLLLVIRTRKFYKTDKYKKFREEAKAAAEEMVVVSTVGNGSGRA